MRISISNIAWDVSEDKKILNLLKEFHIDAIDIVPGKYFRNPEITTDREINIIKNWWFKNGIEIIGMQSLLFNKSNMNIFGTKETRLIMLDYLKSICHIGNVIGAKRIVFGSPKNRNSKGLSNKETEKIAMDFFNRLGDIAIKENVIICLEPCPVQYGCNFMNTSFETAKIVTKILHPAIKMQLDTGAINMNNEDVLKIFSNYSAYIGHIHISEPNLIPLGDGTNDHINYSKIIKKYLPKSIVSIEMLATKKETHFASIRRALMFANRVYRPLSNI